MILALLYTQLSHLLHHAYRTSATLLSTLSLGALLLAASVSAQDAGSSDTSSSTADNLADTPAEPPLAESSIPPFNSTNPGPVGLGWYATAAVVGEVNGELQKFHSPKK